MSKDNTPNNWGFKTPKLIDIRHFAGCVSGVVQGCPSNPIYNSEQALQILNTNTDDKIHPEATFLKEVFNFKEGLVREGVERLNALREKDCEQQLIIHLHKQLEDTKEQLALAKRKVSWWERWGVTLKNMSGVGLYSTLCRLHSISLNREPYPLHVLKGDDS